MADTHKFSRQLFVKENTERLKTETEVNGERRKNERRQDFVYQLLSKSLAETNETNGNIQFYVHVTCGACVTRDMQRKTSNSVLGCVFNTRFQCVNLCGAFELQAFD